MPLTSIDIVMGDTELCPWDMGTFGSLSIRQFGPILRTAAAEARGVLIQLASERLQLPVAELRAEAGSVVHVKNAAARVTYGQLTEGRRIERRVDRAPALDAVASFTVVGTSAPRRDALDKVAGKAKFAGDVVPAGALHARILRPPAHGATLVSADTSAAEAIAGVRVVRDGELVAVLHAHRDEADQALALVKATFSPSPSRLDETTIFDHLVKTAPAGDVVREGGTLAEGARLATEVVEATYLNSYVAHAPMGRLARPARAGRRRARDRDDGRGNRERDLRCRGGTAAAVADDTGASQGRDERLNTGRGRGAPPGRTCHGRTIGPVPSAYTHRDPLASEGGWPIIPCSRSVFDA